MQVFIKVPCPGASLLLAISLFALTAPRAESQNAQRLLGPQKPQPPQAPFILDTRTPISSLPFTVNECGSYFLTGCLTGQSGQDGITIQADDVTLDLNGFSLIGVPGSGDGIKTTPGKSGGKVESGFIFGWGGDGADTQNSFDFEFDGIKLFGNGGAGISAGNGTKVDGSTSSGNGGTGIGTGDGSSVRKSSSRNNTGTGISAGKDCQLEGCSALFNGDSGIVLNGGTIFDCQAIGNGQDGIVIPFTVDSDYYCTSVVCSKNTGSGLVVEGRGTASSGIFNANGAAGILLDPTAQNNRVEGCSFAGNATGLDVDGTGNVVIKNCARGNTTNYSVVAGNDVGPIGTANSLSSPWGNISN